jgi:cell division protein FtsW
MARKLQSDKWLFLATLALVCGSVVMVYSASALLALERYEQPYLFVTKQMMWAVLGLAVLSIVMKIDYRTYRNETLVWTLVGGVGLLLIAVLFSPPINGSRRWFSIGPLGIQPSELAKIVAIVFTAAVLERRMHRVNELKYSLLPIAIVIGALVGLILIEPDLGTAILLVAVIGLMVFVAGISYRYIFGTVILALPALYVLVWSAEYRRRRLLAFLDPWADPLGDGFQVIQSMIAIGTGGVTGKGLMAGVQKLFYLPEPHTDFIFAVLSEELGLVGATVIVACFCVIAWRGLRAATYAPDPFGSFLALGLTMMIVLQAFVNISVVMGLLPTKGITLPLVSSGGSSLLVNLLAMGVLLNVSQHAHMSAHRAVASPQGVTPAAQMGAA